MPNFEIKVLLSLISMKSFLLIYTWLKNFSDKYFNVYRTKSCSDIA